MKVLYSENFKTMMKEIEDTNRKLYSAYGLEWANLIHTTIISTTVGKNPLEEME